MTDIRISYGTLDGAVSHLDVVATQLSASDGTSEAAAAAVGDEALARRVREFADSWDDNRARFQGAAEDLAHAVEGIAAAFRDLDVRLAAEG